MERRISCSCIRRGQRERDECAGDRRGARAAVGLDDVAVEPDGALPELLQFDDRRASIGRSAAESPWCGRRPCRRRLARRARRGGARQHAVLGRDPALAAAAQKRRHAIFDARRADDARPPTSIRTEPSACSRKFGVMLGRPSSWDAIVAHHEGLWGGSEGAIKALIFPQRPPQVHMAGECVDFMSFDQDLHLRTSGDSR